MLSIIYVSESVIDPQNRRRILDDMLAESLSRNTMLEITGLLIASPHHFAQLLEGHALPIAAVMASIAADPRHRAMRILREAKITEPSCPHWRMARFDSANFGNNGIAPLLMAAHDGKDDDAIRRLERLIDAIAAGTEIIRQ